MISSLVVRGILEDISVFNTPAQAMITVSTPERGEQLKNFLFIIQVKTPIPIQLHTDPVHAKQKNRRDRNEKNHEMSKKKTKIKNIFWLRQQMRQTGTISLPCKTACKKYRKKKVFAN